MPHVVLEGSIELEALLGRITPVLINEGTTILKVSEAFMNCARSTILLESLVIEQGVKRSFFAAISKRDDGVVVRIYPTCDVERTRGVFRLIAEIAKRIIAIVPELRVGKTNLQEYL